MSVVAPRGHGNSSPNYHVSIAAELQGIETGLATGGPKCECAGDEVLRFIARGGVVVIPR